MRIRLFAVIAAAFLATTALQATPFGTPTLTLTGPGIDRNTPVVVHLTFEGDIVNGTGDGPSFSWGINADADPIINWGLIALVPGAYHMEFFLPLVPGSYDVLRNQASVTLSDGGDGPNGTTVSAITIDGQVPNLVSVPSVLLTGGPITAPSGDIGGGSLGTQLAVQNFLNPFAMQIVVDFVMSSPDNDGSAAFTGQLLLTNLPSGDDGGEVPEPATTALIGLGLVGIAGLRTRLRK